MSMCTRSRYRLDREVDFVRGDLGMVTKSPRDGGGFLAEERVPFWEVVMMSLWFWKRQNPKMR